MVENFVRALLLGNINRSACDAYNAPIALTKGFDAQVNKSSFRPIGDLDDFLMHLARV